MLEGSRGAARRALRREVFDGLPPEFSGLDVVDASVIERVMRRPSSSMSALVSLLVGSLLCLQVLVFPLVFFVGLLPSSLVGLRRFRALDETSAKAMEAFDVLCPCLFLVVIRGMLQKRSVVECSYGLELNVIVDGS